MRPAKRLLPLAVLFLAPLALVAQQTAGNAPPPPIPTDAPKLAALKKEAVAAVDARAKMVQQIVDQVFSYGELGFQEVETSRYLTDILRKNGFEVKTGVSGIPTAWIATWGSGKPVLALGSDIDGIPQASQKPGVAYRAPMIEGAPGHGEGHNSGQAVNIVAAIALKEIMEREKIPGTIMLWPGVAEELIAAKAYYVRDGVFKDVDVALFSHVSSDLTTQWGSASGNGLISLLYSFEGSAAHAAGAPWRGRSALDAVELMNVGWNYRREHLRYQQRSHYVVRDGGDQPNVVPSTASVWYYLRETDYPHIRDLWAIADSIAEGAALMTGTQLQPVRVMGTAWPQHFNRPVAEAMFDNVRRVGMPQWSDADQQMAKAVQRMMGQQNPSGLRAETRTRVGTGVPEEDKRGGGSDDIGDVSWVVPTVTLRYPSNIPGTPGHSWMDAISMATPIAHKGAVAGAKVMAMTMLDLYTKPALVASARSYFTDVQTRDVKYTPLLRADDKPPTELNEDIMGRYRDEMRKFYYDPTKFGSYLEQLGITYPTVGPNGGR